VSARGRESIEVPEHLLPARVVQCVKDQLT
jgi:hypothetical protein